MARLFYTLLLFLLSGAPLLGQPIEVTGFQFDRMGFYAIGWSPKSYFAYGILLPSGEDLLWRWFIQDLVEDTIKYESLPVSLGEKKNPLELWRANPQWQAQLTRFGVTPQKEYTTGGQTFQQGADDYQIFYSLDRSESFEYPQGQTRRIEVEVVRNGTSAKIVYSYSPKEGESQVEDLILKGYVLSPYEKRVALVALEQEEQVRRLPRWSYRVIGAHLTLGFKPIKQQESSSTEAVYNGQYYVLRGLLKEGADPDAKDTRGYSLLFLAARLGHTQIIQLLLTQGGQVDNFQDDRGQSAFHYVAQRGSRNLITEFLKRGADPELKNNQGQSPKDLALSRQDPTITALFD